MNRSDERWERNTEVCRCCGQKLPDIRFGVRLTPLKARIFDAVQRNKSGASPDFVRRFAFRGKDVAPDTLKAHIWQLNSLLKSTGFRIDFYREHGNGGSFYRLLKQVARHG